MRLQQPNYISSARRPAPLRTRYTNRLNPRNNRRYIRIVPLPCDANVGVDCISWLVAATAAAAAAAAAAAVSDAVESQLDRLHFISADSEVQFSYTPAGSRQHCIYAMATRARCRPVEVVIKMMTMMTLFARPMARMDAQSPTSRSSGTCIMGCYNDIRPGLHRCTCDFIRLRDRCSKWSTTVVGGW